MSSKHAKLEAVKEHIRIQGIIFGWFDLHFVWSKKGVLESPEQRFQYLVTFLIPAQTQHNIPTHPNINLPSCAETTYKLETLSKDALKLN